SHVLVIDKSGKPVNFVLVSPEPLIIKRPADFPTRPGAYKIGEWEYTYSIVNPGSRSEIRVGELKRNGNPVEGKWDEVIDTPLGRFKYFGNGRYLRGWLNTVHFDRPVFPEVLWLTTEYLAKEGFISLRVTLDEGGTGTGTLTRD